MICLTSLKQNNLLQFINKLKLKTFTIIGLVLYIIFLQECNDNSSNNSGDNNKVDTIYSRTIDSIFIKDTLYLTSRIVHHDTVYINNDTVSVYTNKVEDEMLSGEITSYIDGTLVDQDFKYVAKFPQYIRTSDTIRITKTKSYTRVWLGGELGGNIDRFNISPVVGWTNKKGNAYYYRYGIVDKTHNIGITRTIYKK